jgi:osmoprotectant transport system ATP-binding protein
MIRLEKVSKVFPGGTRPAVDTLDLEVAGGQTCVLIGPSGCGKTTTMRIVNRLIEPSAGRIIVEGKDVTGADPVQLRRRIGYVIQQVGLFPHMTIGQNVATVPHLLGWDDARTARRVEEMLVLVGLEPGQFIHRYPRHLSGGQRQRVGVARALAADPPVLLMDEPFGAVDPIVRTSLQSELLAILRRLRKTVIFVTHDIDEAIRMGDLVAIMKDGRLVQCDPPERLLSAPKDSFVADFVGADRALKRLALTTAAEAATQATPGDKAPSVAPATSLRDVLSLLLASGADVANVVKDDGTPIGTVSLATIRERAARPG